MLKKSFLFFLFFLFTFVCIGCFGDGGPLGVSARSDSVSTGFGSYDKGTKKISVGLGLGSRIRILTGSEPKKLIKDELGLDWYYTWNWEQARFMGNDTSVEFVPMMGRLVNYEERIDIIKRRQPYPHFILLGNEPWHHVRELAASEREEEHDLVTQRQLDTLERLVKEFPDSNVVKIGSPGIAWSMNTLTGVTNFMRAVNRDPDKYRIDFMVFHNYGINYNAYRNAINTMFQFKYQGRDLKVWLTEFGPNYDGFNQNYYSPESTQTNIDKMITNFLPETLYQFNTNDRLERYSWWSYPIFRKPDASTASRHLRLFTNRNGDANQVTLTPLGKVYAKYIKDPPMTRPTRAETQRGGRYGPD